MIKTIFATVYLAVASQTDSSPLLTADMTYIECEEHQRIIAVSHDLEQIYPLGSTVYVDCDNCVMEGVWNIHDRMNKRYAYCNMIDFLISEDQYKGLVSTSFDSISIYN